MAIVSMHRGSYYEHMKKSQPGRTRFAIIAVILLLVVGSGLFVLSSDNKEQVIPATPSAAKAQDTSEPTELKPDVPAAASASPGAYVDYTTSVIASTKGTKVLFFHAPWCPQCRALEQSITSSGVPDGVTIIKVDYDSNQALRQKYKVTLQTTLVKIDDSGAEQKKVVAYEDPSIEFLKRNLL